MLFKRLNRLFCVIFLMFAWSAVIAAANPDTKKSTKLAVVNVSVLMKESPRAKSLGEEIKNKYLPQEEALTKEGEHLKELEERLDKDTDKQENNIDRIKNSRAYRERKRDYTRNYESFRDQLSTARQDALIAVRQEVREAIDTVREEHEIDVVIENYISASDSVDITQAVIRHLEESYKKEQNLESAQVKIEEKEAQ